MVLGGAVGDARGGGRVRKAEVTAVFGGGAVVGGAGGGAGGDFT